MTEAASRRRPTIMDVAQAAGVSRAAVSKVIRDAHGVSPAMRARVQQAIEQLDYRPSAAARGLRGASFTVGLELPHLANPFLIEIAAGAREALLGTPYHLVIGPAAGQEQGAIEALVDQRVDGIIAISTLVKPSWFETLGERLPLVNVGRHDNPTAYDTVVGDDLVGARQVMDHLLGLGHRRIAHFTENPEITAEGSGTPHSLRLRVYKECMAAAGLEDEALVLRVRDDGHHARETTLALLSSRQPPTAIFASHDSLAIGALAAIAESGLTTRDVAVAGYDNIPLASHPLISLTSVDQAGRMLGEQAVAMLLERILGRTEARNYTATAVLMARASTAAPAMT